MAEGNKTDSSQWTLALLVLGIVIVLLLLTIHPDAPLPLDRKALRQCEDWYSQARNASESMSVALRVPMPQAIAPGKSLKPCAEIKARFPD